MTDVVAAPTHPIAAACRTLALEAGLPYFHGDFGPASLLVVDEGFVVVRAVSGSGARSVITCEAGPGEVLLPPAPEEALVALTTASVRAIDTPARTRLFACPVQAEHLFEQLALALRHKQQAASNLSATRHVDRLRRRLLQLANRYGHVVRTGVRIDFPLSHALLAEMIGSSRETVTRALDELQRAGVVTRDGSSYRLFLPPESVTARENSHRL